MPKKLLKRFFPSQEFIQKHPSLSFLGPVLQDPNLFHLNRYSVSMAFLVGMFLAFFPAPGQMVLAGFVAFWLRCNLPIAIALVWITNPITIPPSYAAIKLLWRCHVVYQWRHRREKRLKRQQKQARINNKKQA